MHISSRQSRSLSWVGLLAFSRAAQAVSGSVEVDLIFPQNDTYAPAHIVPIVFAFQNPDLAAYLHPSISFYIEPYDDHNKTVAVGSYDFMYANFTGSDPFLQYGDALETLNTEGTWRLIWQLTAINCSGSNTENLHIGRDVTRRPVIFTTKNGAKKPDFAAATKDDTCSNAQGSVFKITETMDSGDTFENRKPCAVLAETTAAPNPCGVKIDDATAANASASLTRLGCAQSDRPTWCPEPEEDAAPILMGPSLAVGSLTLLAATLGGLGYLLV